MTTAISIEDVRREVKILRALSGHNNLVKFYDACEDGLNVYIVMEYVFLWLLYVILTNILKIFLQAIFDLRLLDTHAKYLVYVLHSYFIIICFFPILSTDVCVIY